MADKIEWHPNGTPGPWIMEADGDEHYIIGHPKWKCTHNGKKGEWQIAVTDDLLGEFPDEAEANARAIAEVPAMVDVLRRFVAVGVYRNNQIGIDARAILARIDGEANNATL